MLNMGAVLVLLIGVTDGVKTVCNATQPYITTQCFGSLGGTVEVQLPAQSSQNYIYKLTKNNVQIAMAAVIITDTRYSFNVITGIFTIKDVNRSDIGTYSMLIHNGEGMEIANATCFLSIQAPVSSPHLSRVCLSRGQQRVSCSAGGDGPHYSWSLDGHPLNDMHLLSGPSTASDITLELGLLGLLTCSVSNNVSNAAANITLSVCYGFIYVNCTANGTHISKWVLKDNNTLCIETAATEEPGSVTNTGYVNCTSNGAHKDNNTLCIKTTASVEPGTVKIKGLVPIIAGSLSAMALLVIVAFGVYCAKKQKPSKDTTEAEDVTYADISVLQQQGRQRKQRESEVEYGQVKVAPGLRQTLETNVDDCVYSQPPRLRP